LPDARPRVDFYILEAPDPSARLRFSCRLTEKAYGLSHTIHAHLDDAEQARELDELLWTFRAGSFVPHELAAASRSAQAPVTIGWTEPVAAIDGVLINLSRLIPPFFDRFARVAEILDGTAECRRLGREKFRFYRDNGYTPDTHTIG
jgi:DNA polymerase-3 subunit chi